MKKVFFIVLFVSLLVGSGSADCYRSVGSIPDTYPIVQGKILTGLNQWYQIGPDRFTGSFELQATAIYLPPDYTGTPGVKIGDIVLVNLTLASSDPPRVTVGGCCEVIGLISTDDGIVLYCNQVDDFDTKYTNYTNCEYPLPPPEGWTPWGGTIDPCQTPLEPKSSTPPGEVYIKVTSITYSSSDWFSGEITLERGEFREFNVSKGLNIKIAATGVNEFSDDSVPNWNATLGIYENGNLVSKKIKVRSHSGESKPATYEYVATENRTFEVLIYVNQKPEIFDVKKITIGIFPDSYNITATAGTGGIISPSGQISMLTSAAQRFDITPYYGYQIADVIVDGQSMGAIQNYIFSHIRSDHQIHATFAELPRYTIIATAGTGGNISNAGQVSVPLSAPQRYDITPSDGYQIADVIVDGQSEGAATSYTFSSVHSNHQIHATFTEVPQIYYITATADTGGSITPSGKVSVTAGADQGFTIIPSSGYRISDVNIDGLSWGAIDHYTFSNVQQNHEITATFDFLGKPGIPLGSDFTSDSKSDLLNNIRNNNPYPL
jgi:hypothetical protein